MVNGNSFIYKVMNLLNIFNGIPCIFIYFQIVLSVFSFIKGIKSTLKKGISKNEEILQLII